MKNNWQFISLTGVVILFMVGCAGYEAIDRSTASSGMDFTLSPIQNKSTVPNVVIPLQRELRFRFLQEGFDLDDSENLLKIELLDYQRHPISTDDQDSGRPVTYRIHLAAKVIWDGIAPSPFGSDEIILRVENSAFVATSLVESEDQVREVLVRELAEKVVNSVAHHWK